MHPGAFIKGDIFEAVLHGAAPIVAYGHMRSGGDRCALVYRFAGREEAIIVGYKADYTLKELLAKLEGKRGRPVRQVMRRTAAPPATVEELRERMKQLLAGGQDEHTRRTALTD